LSDIEFELHTLPSLVAHEFPTQSECLSLPVDATVPGVDGDARVVRQYASYPICTYYKIINVNGMKYMKWMIAMIDYLLFEKSQPALPPECISLPVDGPMCGPLARTLPMIKIKIENGNEDSTRRRLDDLMNDPPLPNGNVNMKQIYLKGGN
jgi:hypothetical protein